MLESVFTEQAFLLLIIISVIIPVAAYGFLYTRRAISTTAVLLLAILLMFVAIGDVVLLQVIAKMAKATPSQRDDAIFAGELGIALYVCPLMTQARR